MKENSISLFQSQLRTKPIPVKLMPEAVNKQSACHKLIKSNQHIQLYDKESISHQFHNLKMLPVIKTPIIISDKINKSNSKSPFKIKDFTTIKKSIKDKINQTTKKLNFTNVETCSTTSAEDKKNNQNNRIDILYELEKHTITIQRLWRGWVMRKKYKGLLNIMHKSGNNNNNKGFLNINNNYLTVSLSNRSNLSNISINIEELDESSSDNYDIFDDDF